MPRVRETVSEKSTMEKIAKLIHLWCHGVGCKWDKDKNGEGEPEVVKNSYRERAKQLFKDITELAIVDLNAYLPENPYRKLSFYHTGYAQAQADMIKAGWVKEVK